MFKKLESTNFSLVNGLIAMDACYQSRMSRVQ